MNGRKQLVIALMTIVTVGGCAAPPTVQPTPQVIFVTPEPTATARPTPRPTPAPTPAPTPQAGTSYTVWVAHILGVLQPLVDALGGFDSGDIYGMTLAAGEVASLADAELIYIGSSDPQPCYQAEFDQWQTTMVATSTAYHAAHDSLAASDVAAMNVAIGLINAANDELNTMTGVAGSSSCP